MLEQTYTSTQAPTCRRLQLSIIFHPFLEGSYNPLFSFTSYHWKGATTPSLKVSTLRSTTDHVSSTSTQHTLQAIKFIYFLQRCILNSDLLAICYPFRTDILQSEVFIHNPCSCIHSLESIKFEIHHHQIIISMGASQIQIYQSLFIHISLKEIRLLSTLSHAHSSS